MRDFLTDPRAKDAKEPTTVSLYVEVRRDGSPLSEEVLADRLGENRYRVLASPGLLNGLAAGDEFETFTGEKGTRFRVLSRGGNVSIQFFAPQEILRECERYLLDSLGPIGGRLDGKDKTLLVWTVPVKATFQTIEQPFNDLQSRFPNCEWMFGNVYGEDGKTPLDWWK